MWVTRPTLKEGIRPSALDQFVNHPAADPQTTGNFLDDQRGSSGLAAFRQPKACSVSRARPLYDVLPRMFGLLHEHLGARGETPYDEGDGLLCLPMLEADSSAQRPAHRTATACYGLRVPSAD